jgi:quercetin dioxygenase-like cupin family protein
MRPEPRWFIDNLVRIHCGREETGGRSSLIEAEGRHGDMPPLHVHHRDDETFFVLDGTLTLIQPDAEVALQAGSSFRAAKGIPHVYRVDSPVARWLVFNEPGGFDTFVLDASVPAEREELPPPGRPQDPEALAAAAARQGTELLGPPGTLP